MISRDDLDKGLVDLGRVAGKGEVVAPPHPGEILREEFLDPMGITPYRLAKEIGVHVNRVTAILAGKRSITADTAMRIARYLGTSPMFWMNLQTHYELEVARIESEAKIIAEVKPIPVPEAPRSSKPRRRPTSPRRSARVLADC